MGHVAGVGEWGPRPGGPTPDRLRSAASMETPSAASQRVFAPGTFTGRVAIVTGGGSGIGLATTQELVRLGARVAICGRTAEKLDAARAQLGDDVLAQPCDIREPAQVEQFVRDVVARFGQID